MHENVLHHNCLVGLDVVGKLGFPKGVFCKGGNLNNSGRAHRLQYLVLAFFVRELLAEAYVDSDVHRDLTRDSLLQAMHVQPQLFRFPPFTKKGTSQTPKGPKIETIKSRLKFSILLENFNLA